MNSKAAKHRQPAAKLRRKAEKRIEDSGGASYLPKADADSLKLLHELQVHKIELEMQNEELQRSQDELRASQEKYVLLYDFAPIAYFTLARDGSILTVNLTGADLLRIERTRLIKRNFSSFLDAPWRQTFTEFLEQVFVNPDKCTCELMISKGRPKPLYLQVEAAADEPGEECLIAMVDISTRKQAEEALNRAHNELEQRVVERTAELLLSVNSQKKEMAMRLQAVEDLRKTELMMVQQNRLAAMGEMIINIAHQWRQPLNVMGLLVQQLGLLNDLDNLSKEEFDDNITKIMEILNHLSHTINEFQASMVPDREKSRFRINEVIKNMVSLVGGHFSDQRITIEIDGEGDPQANGFPNEFGQVLLNLLTNARDALVESTRGERWIRLCSRIENNRAIVTVADNGGGVEDGIMYKIFDPYFTTKERGKGSGIGLFMSKMIIEKNMGGSITARNTGIGTEFRIEI